MVTPAPDVLKTTIFAARWRLTLTGLAGSQRIMPLVTVWSAPEREMETWSPAKALPPREDVVSRVTDLTVAVSLRGAMRTVSFFWMYPVSPRPATQTSPPPLPVDKVGL